LVHNEEKEMRVEDACEIVLLRPTKVISEVMSLGEEVSVRRKRKKT
jgi:hypothetical protein